jgi:serine/threonine-protein kinase
MSVEAASESVQSPWGAWQGSVINGAYPLRRVLHATEHGAVFLTEGKLHNLPDAAIKIVRAESVNADLQLRRWRSVAALSHPHLIRLVDSGQCQLGGEQFLFVVMEHAEQTLAQVLTHRALTADEVREMLPATLDALGFLHRKNLVHGRLKPASLLVVNDQLKLASDAVRPAGEPGAGPAHSSLYDPPEAREGRLLPAGDIWGLGVTLVEALGRCLPWPDEVSAGLSLPSTFPRDFVDTIARCLNRDPALRPSAASLATQFKGAPQPPPPVPATPTRKAPEAIAPRAAAARVQSRGPLPLPAAVAIGSLLALVLAWGGWRALHSGATPSANTQSANPAVQPADTPSTQGPEISREPLAAPASTPTHPARAPVKAPASAAPRPASRPAHTAQSPADVSPSVLHAPMPTVAPSAQRTIHGHVKVAVLVIVDRSGTVVDALLQNPGPSSYFARLARDAARKWQFVPAEQPDSRQWLVTFEFARDGTSGHATPHS